MILEEITLINFRNHQKTQINLKEKNILLGKNASGKSSVLEAIGALSSSKKNKNLKTGIRFNEKSSLLKGKIKKGRSLQVFVETRISEAGITRKTNTQTAELKTILFSPDDVQAFKGGPGQRREMLDNACVDLHVVYGAALKNYNRVLKQRNYFLKEIAAGRRRKESIEVFEQKMAEEGERLIRGRTRFLSDALPLIEKSYNKISGGNEKIGLEYKTETPENTKNLVLQLKESYLNRREDEIKKGFSLVGPHLDDFIFLVEGVDVALFGSQGEKRTGALCFRLAEYELLKKKENSAPLVLLDDVMSELDETRRSHLLKIFEEADQAVLTATDRSAIKENLNGEYNLIYL